MGALSPRQQFSVNRVTILSLQQCLCNYLKILHILALFFHKDEFTMEK